MHAFLWLTDEISTHAYVEKVKNRHTHGSKAIFHLNQIFGHSRLKLQMYENRYFTYEVSCIARNRNPRVKNDKRLNKACSCVYL